MRLRCRAIQARVAVDRVVLERASQPERWSVIDLGGALLSVHVAPCWASRGCRHPDTASHIARCATSPACFDEVPAGGVRRRAATLGAGEGAEAWCVLAQLFGAQSLSMSASPDSAPQTGACSQRMGRCRRKRRGISCEPDELLVAKPLGTTGIRSRRPSQVRLNNGCGERSARPDTAAGIWTRQTL